MNNRDLSEAAFMGKITAGVTHEMKNVSWAIIRESAGLMEDLLSVAKDDSFPAREKFLKILIVNRRPSHPGVSLADALNQVAHGPDQPLATVDINRLIDQLVFLCQRFALSKRLTLRNVAHDQSLLFRCEVLKVQMTIFRGIDLFLNVADPGTILTIRPRFEMTTRWPSNSRLRGTGLNFAIFRKLPKNHWHPWSRLRKASTCKLWPAMLRPSAGQLFSLLMVINNDNIANRFEVIRKSLE